MKKPETSLVDARSVQAELSKPQTGPDAPDEAKVANINNKGDLFSAVNVIAGVPPLNIACGAIDTISTLPGVSAINAVVQGIINGPLALAGTSTEELMAEFIGLINGDAINSLAKGAELGNLANIGTFLASNDIARSIGGVPLSVADAIVLKQEQNQIDIEENATKSFAQRYLDPYDRQSLAASIIDSVPAPSAQPSSFTNGLASLFTGGLGNVFASLSPTANAALGDYDYGIPKYGFSLAEQDNPDYEDPYQNAFVVEPFLESQPDGQVGLNEKYGKACFGMTVTADDTGVHIESDAMGSDNLNIFKVRKNHPECDPKNNNDPMFLRYRFYLADSVTAVSLACYEGDEQACSEIGISNAADTPQTDTPVEGVECPTNLKKTIKVGGSTYYQMPEAQNGEYTFDPGTPQAQRYGHKELVCVIYTAAKQYKAKYGDKSTVKVGRSQRLWSCITQVGRGCRY